MNANWYKAMIVAESRLAAIRYRDALEAAKTKLLVSLDAYQRRRTSMPTDYVLFIHGTNVRDEKYAQHFTDMINNMIKKQTPSIIKPTITPVTVYWGDLSVQEEEKLAFGYKASDIWDKLWFKGLREHLALQFVGDAVLYLSRHIGADVAAKVVTAIDGLDSTVGNRFHLVTHSWGSVILFDLLFSTRWDDENTEGRESVIEIRKKFYGLDPNPEQGILLGSITTMGSPIGLFSLMDVKRNPRMESSKYDPTTREASSTHDITPSLEKMLPRLHQKLGKTLPWRNFVHPGDPIASPLKGIIPNMVDKNGTYIDLQDILIPANVAEVFKEPFPGLLSDLLVEPIKQTDWAILGGIHAHGSYWESSQVVEEIVKLF